MEYTQFGTEASEEHMGLQYKAPCGSVTGNEMKSHMEVQTVTDIAKGLRESLKHVQEYRLFMHEEIKDILKRQRTY
ncbi:MAG: hypothetical protein MUO31_16300 [Thermodesulfovibrionales bacterium]|nr:hypothetical protein [Thermodesulfovibrionales bacterium]